MWLAEDNQEVSIPFRKGNYFTRTRLMCEPQKVLVRSYNGVSYHWHFFGAHAKSRWVVSIMKAASSKGGATTMG